MKNQSAATKKLGIEGELFVIEYLKKLGFQISTTNFRKFFGEIDIIACKKNMYIFVEVKTRKSATMPMGNLISLDKQKKIIKTAQAFIVEHKIDSNTTYRFDVALVLKENSSFYLEYIENAFTQHNTQHDYY